MSEPKIEDEISQRAINPGSIVVGAAVVIAYEITSTEHDISKIHINLH